MPRARIGLALVLGALLLGLALYLKPAGVTPPEPARSPVRAPDPQEPVPPSPTPPQPAPRGPDAAPAPVGRETRAQLDACIGRHIRARVKYPARAPQQMLRFDYEKLFGFVPGRLLALTSPAETLALAESLLADGRSDPHKREYALFLLEVLAGAGREEAERLLQRTASGSGKLADQALHSLHQSDPTSKHHPLYLEKCRKGVFSGIWAVADVFDPAAVAALSELERANPGVEFEATAIRGFAQTSRERLELLRSPDWAARLKTILAEGRPEEDVLDWALRAASVRTMPGFVDLLRHRLLEAERKAAEFSKDFAGTTPLPGKASRADEVLDMAGDDRAYDDVLLAYTAAGGVPNEFQKRRLWAYGYLGDPKERLAEFLNAREE